ncbi:Dihydrofolate reductase [Quadrisphaera granulorum]|uniref:Dihydrofolate reductase n=1 Tax=Quadrisphaera granulorum TaxID=317664 RepID=A0A315ZPY7_9ACTN|nr:dihydrofolate reductase family protein [Quadrisphaera granulorum]PWJ46968.1 dihydrofolate reductase [Quadrisphaera granulorum]SZE98964.1 Dihydrofolate reductase [Quadrisphaera granulorum]
MGQLRYWINTSLDGFIADADGRFDWTEPDVELHAFFNDQERELGTHLYGRRLFAMMRYWETALELPDRPEVENEYARIWQAADKVVYSRTLTALDTPRTELVAEFDVDDVRRRKETSERDLSIGGADLAAQAIRAGLVDEIGLVVHPVMVGRGTRALPADVRLDLALLEERRLSAGVVHLRYRVRH